MGAEQDKLYDLPGILPTERRLNAGDLGVLTGGGAAQTGRPIAPGQPIAPDRGAPPARTESAPSRPSNNDRNSGNSNRNRER